MILREDPVNKQNKPKKEVNKEKAENDGGKEMENKDIKKVISLKNNYNLKPLNSSKNNLEEKPENFSNFNCEAQQNNQQKNNNKIHQPTQNYQQPQTKETQIPPALPDNLNELFSNSENQLLNFYNKCNKDISPCLLLNTEKNTSQKKTSFIAAEQMDNPSDSLQTIKPIKITPPSGTQNNEQNKPKIDVQINKDNKNTMIDELSNNFNEIKNIENYNSGNNNFEINNNFLNELSSIVEKSLIEENQNENRKNKKHISSKRQKDVKEENVPNVQSKNKLKKKVENKIFVQKKNKPKKKVETKIFVYNEINELIDNEIDSPIDDHYENFYHVEKKIFVFSEINELIDNEIDNPIDDHYENFYHVEKTKIFVFSEINEMIENGNAPLNENENARPNDDYYDNFYDEK